MAENTHPLSTTGWRGGRPMIMATRGVVSSGHYLATEAGMSILRRGGNAFDAAAAVGFALTVTKPQQNGIGGEVPMVVFSARDKRTYAVSGHGTAPRAATIDHFRSLDVDPIPGDGLLPAVVPPAPASWILLLERFGTMRLADVLQPALDLAEGGFPMYDHLRSVIASNANRFLAEWPTSAEVFLPGGKAPEVGEIWRQPLWARTFKRLLRAERRHKGRVAGLRAAYDEFYRGPIAKAVVRFNRNTFKDSTGRAHAGLLALADLDTYAPRIEDAAAYTYKGMTVHKCGPWTQGPVLLQSLALCEQFNLRRLGHNTPDYIHAVIECMKLAYADREFRYGDPLFAKVPLRRLLSAAYSKERAKLVDLRRASPSLRADGFPEITAESVLDVNAVFAAMRGSSASGKPSGPADGDTTKLEVIDADGNMVSATPSGGWLQSSPVVEGLGFPLGTRGQMFSLVEGHPNSLEPGKRPRTTLTPSLGTLRGRPWMAFGSPGGDAQDQWALQFFLNVVEFGMPLQEAVEAPTFCSLHWPSSFYPRRAEPLVVNVEAPLHDEAADGLTGLGHVVRKANAWSGGNTLAASIDAKTGVLSAAASPRLEPAYAMGW